MGRDLRLWLMVPWCLLLAGCNDITRSVGADGWNFQYQWWVPIVAFVAGIGVVLFGIAAGSRSGFKGFVITVAGAGFAFVMSIGTYREYVRVNDQGFEFRTGFLGTDQAVKFDTVKAVRITHEKDLAQNSSRVDEVLYFDKKAGGAIRFELANDVNIAAGKRIMRLAARKGIRTVHAPGTEYYFFSSQ